MLKSWERRELAVIERSLSRQDPALARALGVTAVAPTIRRRCHIVAVVTSLLSAGLVAATVFEAGADRVVLSVLAAEFALIAGANLFLAHRTGAPPSG